MDYFSRGSAVVGAGATGTLAITGGEPTPLWLGLTVLLVVAGVAMVVLSELRRRRDRGVIEGVLS